MKARNVIIKLFENLPKFTDDFSAGAEIVSMTKNNLKVTVELDRNHNLKDNSYVTLSGINVQNQISNITRSGGQFTLTLTEDHDFTYGFHDVVKISGYNESEFNKSFPLVAVPNRRTVVVKIDEETTPTGAGVVEEQYKKAYNGCVVVQVVSPNSFEYDISKSYGAPKFDSNKAYYAHNIAGAASIQRIIDYYKKESLKSKRLFVELGNTNALRNSGTELNTNYPKEQGDSWKQNLTSVCNLYVITSVSDEKLAFEERDLCVDYRKYLIASISGLTFSSGFSVDKKYQLTFASDNVHYYDGLLYVHKFSFEIVSELSNLDVNEEYDDIAFRDISLEITPDVGSEILTTGVNLDKEPI